MYPRSPYGGAKLHAYRTTANYNDAYGMFAENGILFNHESPLRRGEKFVTRKNTRAAARIKLGLQADEDGDVVIAAGRVHSLRKFTEAVFAALGMPSGTLHPN